MKKCEIAYHNYAEAKRAHQVQKLFIQTLQMKLCVRSKQPRTIKKIVYNDVFTSLRRKKVNKSELSSFFMYLINVKENCNTLQN